MNKTCRYELHETRQFELLIVQGIYTAAQTGLQKVNLYGPGCIYENSHYLTTYGRNFENP